MEKSIIIFIYRPTGEFIKTWSNAKFEGFTKQINSGLGPCTIELGESANYQGDDLALNNIVKIFVVDKDTVGKYRETGDRKVLIYSGYISMYRPWLDSNGWEGITVNLLGNYTKLAQDVWRDGRTIVHNYKGNPTDIGTIFRDVIDKWNTVTMDVKFNYDLATIATTGTTTEYRFELMTYRESIDFLKKIAPANWWWYVNEWGTVYFKSKPAISTHYFTIGRQTGKIEIERSMEKVKNTVMVYNNGLYGGGVLLKYYADTLSTADFGRRIDIISDNRTSVTTDLDKLGNIFITEHKDVDVKVVAEIFDNNDNDFGYDIENVHPGETCSFLGLDQSLADIFNENMLITKVVYTPRKIIITVEPMEAGIVTRQEQIASKVNDIAKESVPTEFKI